MCSANFAIPQEIMDLVIYHARFDSDTLHALSLVSKSWSLPTRGYLFRDIELKEQEECSKLKQLFDERPSLCFCVKNLTIRINTPYNWLNDIDRPSQTILAILPVLDSLARFSILGRYGAIGALHWRGLLPVVQIALYEVMAKPQITSIALSCITDFDILPLTQYLHLEELILDNVQVSGFASTPVEFGACFPLNDPSISNRTGGLRRLDVNVSPGAFRVLLTCSSRREAGTLDMSNLTHLKVTNSNLPNEFEGANWTSLFNLCGASIESYAVHQMAYRRPFSPGIIPFHIFPNLKEFFFKIDYLTADQHGHNSLPVFLEALDKLSREGNTGRASITTIHVEYNGCANYIKNEINGLLEGQRWRWLDAIMRRPAFSRLTDMQFKFKLNCCKTTFWEEGWDTNSGLILSQLSSVEERGILTLTRSF